jgi:uncharacterized cupin superfamily protein
VNPEGNKAYGTIFDSRGSLPLNKLSVYESTASESDEFIFFTVYYPRNTEGHFFDDRPVGFTFTTFADSAIPGRDYETTEGFVELGPDEQEVEIRVRLIDNDWVQGDHTFSIFITSPTPIAKLQAVGTITDNDSTRITIADATGAESSLKVSFPVTLSNPVDSELAFSFTTRVPAGGNDIVEVLPEAPGRVTISSGVQATMIDVVVINDNVQEPSENFTINAEGLLISSAFVTSSQISWAKDSAIGTITDNEFATVSIQDYEVSESAGNLRFDLALSHSITQTNEVQFSIMSGTAMAGTDFTRDTADRSVKSFATRFGGPLPVIASVIIPILNDAIVERTETFTFQLDRVSTGMYTTTKTSSTITVTNDDFATIVVGDATGSETDGNMEFAVTLSHSVDMPVTVVASTRNIEGNTQNPLRFFAVGSNNNAPVVAINSVGGFVVQPDFQLMSET